MHPSPRVTEYIARFDAFMDEVNAIEAAIDTSAHGDHIDPRLDTEGRMGSAVWEARREVQRRAAANDLYIPHQPESAGGAGFSRVEMHFVEEHVYKTAKLGIGLAALAWTEGPNPALAHVSDHAREQYLNPLNNGEITTAFANTEREVGTDVLAMHTHAKKDGTDWIINGGKAWITNSHFADFYQVTAVTEPGAGTRSLSMFLVDKDAPGFRRGEDFATILGDGLTGELHFENVRVPKENIVGEIGQGFALAMSWINWRRLCRGGMCSGWGSWLIDRAVNRAQERKSGGKPIAELQAVQHMIADMEADWYQARATSLIAQAELDEMGPFDIPLDRRAPRIIALVKLINDESFYRLCDNAVQVHGAMGLMRGKPEEKLFRIARNLRIPAGTVEIQRNAIAQALLKPKK